MARIIPCLDIIDGRVVKGKKFKDIKDVESVEKLIKRYAQEGADEIVIYDIMASVEKRKIDLDYIRKITRGIDIPFTLGGGITSLEDIEDCLRANANKISINSRAVNNPRFLEDAAKKFGSRRIVLSIDAKKNKEGSWNVYLEGGKKDTGLDAIEWARKAFELGAGEILVNSIDGDGTKDGYDIELLQTIRKTVPIPIIASGGAGSKKHFYDVIRQAKVDGVLAASVFHFGEVNIKELKEYLRTKVREQTSSLIKGLEFDEKGLIPAIAQDIYTKEVLMLAYMNEESIRKTLERGLVHYYSRSRKDLWQKGETSGNIQRLKGFYYDCDADSLLLMVEQEGLACHTGNRSCFYNQIIKEQYIPQETRDVIEELYWLLKERKENPREDSYTAYLFKEGIDKILKKLGEESSEVIIAAKNHDKDELVYEISDLLYHLLVLMIEKDVQIDDIKSELKKRRKKQ